MESGEKLGVPRFSGRAEDLERWKQQVFRWREAANVCETKKAAQLAAQIDNMSLTEGIDYKRLKTAPKDRMMDVVYRTGPDGKVMHAGQIAEDTDKTYGIDYLIEHLEGRLNKTTVDTSCANLFDFMDFRNDGSTEFIAFLNNWEEKLSKLHMDKYFGTMMKNGTLQCVLLLRAGRLSQQQMAQFWTITTGKSLATMQVGEVRSAMKMICADDQSMGRKNAAGAAFAGQCEEHGGNWWENQAYDGWNNYYPTPSPYTMEHSYAMENMGKFKGKEKGKKGGKSGKPGYGFSGKGKSYFSAMQEQYPWWPEHESAGAQDDVFFAFNGNCGKCGKWGHKSSDCWKGKTKAQVDAMKLKQGKPEAPGANVATADLAVQEEEDHGQGYFGVAWMAVHDGSSDDDDHSGEKQKWQHTEPKYKQPNESVFEQNDLRVAKEVVAMADREQDDRHWRYNRMEKRTDEDSEAGGDAYKHFNHFGFLSITIASACAILDPGCTKDMAGSKWHEVFAGRLHKPMPVHESRVTFTFGNGSTQTSIGRTQLPGTDVSYEIIAGCSTPLLISNPTLRKLKAVLDFEGDTLHFEGRAIKLVVTEKGHYLLDLVEFCGDTYFKDAQCMVAGENAEADLPEPLPGVTRKKPDLNKQKNVTIEQLLRLHRARGHINQEAMMRFLSYIDVTGPEIEKMVEQAIAACPACKKYARDADRPKHTGYIGGQFGRVWATDFFHIADELTGRTILTVSHIIDVWSRLSSTLVTPDETMDSAIRHFDIASQTMGTPKELVSDGGPSYQEKYTDHVSSRGTKHCTTAPYAPFANGIAERHNGLLKAIIKKVRLDPRTEEAIAKGKLDNETVVYMATSHKNENLRRKDGTTPIYAATLYQPVGDYGIFEKGAPYLKGPGTVKEKEVLRATIMKAFAEEVACAEMKLILAGRLRATPDPVENGLQVSFYDAGHGCWKGPGTVIGKERGLVVVRYGSRLYTVARNRIRNELKDGKLNVTTASTPAQEQLQVKIAENEKPGRPPKVVQEWKKQLQQLIEQERVGSYLATGVWCQKHVAVCWWRNMVLTIKPQNETWTLPYSGEDYASLDRLLDKIGLGDGYKELQIGTVNYTATLVRMYHSGLLLNEVMEEPMSKLKCSYQWTGYEKAHGLVRPSDRQALRETQNVLSRAVGSLDEESSGGNGTWCPAVRPEPSVAGKVPKEVKQLQDHNADGGYWARLQPRNVQGSEQQRTSMEGRESTEALKAADAVPTRQVGTVIFPSGINDVRNTSKVGTNEMVSSSPTPKPKSPEYFQVFTPEPDKRSGSPRSDEALFACDLEYALATEYANGTVFLADITTDNEHEVAMVLQQAKKFKKKKLPKCVATKEELQRFAAEFDQAKRDELKSIVEHGVWRDITTKELDETMKNKAVPTIWVLTFKRRESDGVAVVVKARLVAQGFKDARIVDRYLSDERGEIIRTDSPTMSGLGLRVIVATAACRGWTVRFSDISTAFLQGYEYQPHERVVVRLPDGTYKLLYKSLYGLNDAPRRWNTRLMDELKKLLLKESVVDSQLLYLTQGNRRFGIKLFEECLEQSYEELVVQMLQDVAEHELEGIVGVHVDDLIGTGNDEFLDKVWVPLCAILNFKHITDLVKPGDSFVHLGQLITRVVDGYTIDQQEYIATIRPMEFELGQDRSRELDKLEHAAYRQVLGETSWATTHTRPDGACMNSKAASHQSNPTVADALDLNQLVSFLRKNNHIHLSYRKLQSEQGASMELVVHGDASFAKEDERKSRGGMVLLLCGDIMENGFNLGSILTWGTSTIKRVCRSTLGSELLVTQACVDMGDYVTVLLIELQLLRICNGEYPPAVVVTDARSVETTARTCKVIREKNLLTDLFRLRQRITAKSVSLLWCSTHVQLGDPLTKIVKKPHVLWKAMMTGLFVRSGEKELADKEENEIAAWCVDRLAMPAPRQCRYWPYCNNPDCKYAHDMLTTPGGLLYDAAEDPDWTMQDSDYLRPTAKAAPAPVEFTPSFESAVRRVVSDILPGAVRQVVSEIRQEEKMRKRAKKTMREEKKTRTATPKPEETRTATTEPAEQTRTATTEPDLSYF